MRFEHSSNWTKNWGFADGHGHEVRVCPCPSAMEQWKRRDFDGISRQRKEKPQIPQVTVC